MLLPMGLAAAVAFGAHAQQVPGRAQTPTAALPQSVASAPIPTFTTAQPEPQASSEWIVDDKTDLIRVPIDKYALVRLPETVDKVWIGQPNVAEVRKSEGTDKKYVFILGRAPGATSLIFEDATGNIVFQGDIQVDVDVSGIRAAIAEILPEDKIDVTAQRGTVMLNGFVRSPGASSQAVDIAGRYAGGAANIINNLEILGSRQVVMQVRVAEIKRTAIKQLGFNFDYSFNIANRPAGTLSMASIAYKPFLETAKYASGTLIPHLTGFGAIAYRVLEENGLAKTLAEPTLTAISGSAASFLAGGTFPQQSGTDQNGNAVYTQIPYGVGLKFTPTVLDDGRINLQISTENSAIDKTLTPYGTTKKETKTTVDLPSGGSMMISGLIQNDINNTIDGVPGLKDVPVLGALFRSEAFKNEETELVIVVTAYLAKPVGHDARMALPTDGFAMASDIDYYLLGRLHKQYTRTELPPYATPLAGPYGHIME
ncbi:MAG: type II and III secretion system protein family protein [Alphaproteobacteria bacterium]|nr:type II and III secretion system protein family protein [Alphaproteobacteria bacterium]